MRRLWLKKVLASRYSVCHCHYSTQSIDIDFPVRSANERLLPHDVSCWHSERLMDERETSFVEDTDSNNTWKHWKTNMGFIRPTISWCCILSCQVHLLQLLAHPFFWLDMGNAELVVVRKSFIVCGYMCYMSVLWGPSRKQDLHLKGLHIH